MIKRQQNFSVSLVSAYLVFVTALLLLMLDEDNTVAGMKGLFSGKSKSKKKEEPSTHQEDHQKDEEQSSQPSYDYGYGYGYGGSYGESDHGGSSYGVIHHESPKASPPRAVIDHAYQEPTEVASAMGKELFWSPVKADDEFWSNPDEHMPTYKAAQEMKENEEAKAKGSKKKKGGLFGSRGSGSGKNKEKDEDE